MYKFDKKPLDKEIDTETRLFLVMTGNVLKNEFAANSPVVTGLLKNSMSYSIHSEPALNKDGVSSPGKKNTVRVGSGVIYAASVEARGKSAGWMSRIWDLFLRSGKIEKIARIAYGAKG